MLYLNPRSWLLWLMLLTSLPAVAQPANFEKLTLALGFNPTIVGVSGHTGGAYSLSSLANQDNKANACLGFSDSTPDHTMILETDFPQLTLQVNSGGQDTTIVVKGPNGKIWCGDDSGSDKDASISDRSWPKGTYSIWVGAFEENQRWSYRLTAREN